MKIIHCKKKDNYTKDECVDCNESCKQNCNKEDVDTECDCIHWVAGCCGDSPE